MPRATSAYLIDTVFRSLAMLFTRPTILAIIGTALAAGPMLQGQQPAGVGSTPSTYRSFIVVDERTDAKAPQNRTGKLHDLVNENSLNPVIAVFANAMPSGDDSTSKLVKKLKDIQSTYKNDEFGAFVVFAVLDTDYTI
jgi:hypothetical protein